MVDCNEATRAGACLAANPFPRMSRRLPGAARKAGLPETASSLDEMRREFARLRWDSCGYCAPNGKAQPPEARQALDAVRLHLGNEAGALDALIESASIIRIRPGMAPEETPFGIFKLFRSAFYLSRSRYVDGSTLAEELAGISKKITAALDAAEKVLQPAAKR